VAALVVVAVKIAGAAGLSVRTITDLQWALVAPLLSGKVTDYGVTARNNRLFFNAVVWLLRTGAAWADLPERFS